VEYKKLRYSLLFGNIFIITLICFSVCSIGCESVPEINRSFIEHSIAVERSQNAQRELIAIIDRAGARLEAIERTAGLLQDNIERIGILFAEYDSIVREIIDGINRVQNSLSAGVGNYQSFSDNRGDNNNR